MTQKEPKQYPIGGYAPGNYINTCIDCKEYFLGDKKAVQCEACAVIEMVEDKAETDQILKEAKEKALKQETFEEFIESQPYYGTCTTEYKEGIEVGAKWQAERMYSEEEVLVLLHKRDKHNLDNPNTFNGWKTPKEWFEQNKKK